MKPKLVYSVKYLPNKNRTTNTSHVFVQPEYISGEVDDYIIESDFIKFTANTEDGLVGFKVDKLLLQKLAGILLLIER